jgi:hypothetical protein
LCAGPKWRTDDSIAIQSANKAIAEREKYTKDTLSLLTEQTKMLVHKVGKKNALSQWKTPASAV